jgi:hypothetical protein
MRKMLSILCVVLFAAVPVFAAPSCHSEWTKFNCAIWQLGVDESAAYKTGGMSYEQFVMLTDIHADIFWTAKALETSERSHDMQTLSPKLNNYRIEVNKLLFIRVIGKVMATRLINDSVELENAMTAGKVWFGNPEAVWAELEE